MLELITHRERRDDGAVVLTVIGELDQRTAPALRAVLAEHPPHVVDCRFVPLMTAAGLAVLLEARGRRPFETVASLATRRVAVLTELDEALALVDPADPPALDQATYGVAVHDEQLRYLYVNPTMARLNGLPVDRHLGRRPDEVFVASDDELTEALHAVIATRRRRSTAVFGATAAGPGRWWCTYLPVPHRYHGTDVDAVLATVAPGDGTDDEPEAALTLRVGGRS